MQFTITDAAKLYRKQRKTLYRHIDAGRLSCSVRGDGHRVIDFSELLRVYGDPPGQAPGNDTPVTRDSPEDDTPLTRALLAELVAINRRQAEQLEALTAKVERLESAMLRLPAPDKPDTAAGRQEKPQEPRQADTPADDTRNELRSLVAALRQSEE